MFSNSPAFSGFSTDDLAAAVTFYSEILGLSVVRDEMGFIDIELGSGGRVLVYEKSDHEPATYTVLNFPVDDIDSAVDALTERGVSFERYTGMDQDEKGISRGIAAGIGPDIAWFTDPAGNIIAVLTA